MLETLEKAQEILTNNTLPDRYTKFQVEKFMIGKEPTGHAQLWQCIRELETRVETLESFDKDLSDAEDNLELFDVRIERLSREIRKLSKEEGDCLDLNIQEHEINIRKLQREKVSLIKSAQKLQKKRSYVLEEIRFLIECYEKIRSEIGNSKPLDDEEAQKEMWNEKFLEELNLRWLLAKPIDPELARTIMCLNDEAPAKATMKNILTSQLKLLGSGQTKNQGK